MYVETNDATNWKTKQMRGSLFVQLNILQNKGTI